MKNFLFLGLAVIAATVFSCSSQDDLLDEVVASDSWYSTPLESDQSFFANIAVNGVGANTRADMLGDYAPGSYDPSLEPNFDNGGSNATVENDVKTIFLVFYDENGDRVSTTQVRRENASYVTDGRNNSENKIYSGVVQIDIKHGSLPPAYVMAFVNPITSTNFEINPDFATLESLEKVTKPRIIDDNNNFAMSKSVYYGINRVKEDSQELEKIVATPLPKAKLFSTADKAKEALMDAIINNGSEEKPEYSWSADEEKNSGIVDIYVERYAAKVEFEVEDVAKNNSLSIGEETLVFVPEYWAVNAYESETYVVKSFLGADNKTMSYKTMNDALGGEKAWYWNSQLHHRSYWAQSPAYYAEKYPRVADDIKDTGTFDEDNSAWSNPDYILGYYSYNQMVKLADGKLISKARSLSKDDKTDSKFKKLIYARENTVSGKALQNAYSDPLASPKAAIASVVLVGHYEIGDEGKAPEGNFYVMGNATNGYTLYKNDDEMLNYFVNTTIRFYKDSKGAASFFEYALEGGSFIEEDYKEYFVIEHPSKTSRKTLEEDLVVDSRFVTIQLNKETVLKEDAKALYAYIDGKYVAVNEGNIDEINKQMFYAAGTAQGYQGGKAYFTIPIKHLGFYRKDNPNEGKNANDKDFKWTSVQSGDFGLVRNHSYSIAVESIEGLGNGIPDPNDPIVPPTDPEEYFIGARLIVLNWAIVPQQKVKL